MTFLKNQIDTKYRFRITKYYKYSATFCFFLSIKKLLKHLTNFLDCQKDCLKIIQGIGFGVFF